MSRGNRPVGIWACEKEAYCGLHACRVTVPEEGDLRQKGISWPEAAFGLRLALPSICWSTVLARLTHWSSLGGGLTACRARLIAIFTRGSFAQNAQSSLFSEVGPRQENFLVVKRGQYLPRAHSRPLPKLDHLATRFENLLLRRSGL